MNDNIKNLLQEYYQKSKLDIPKYRHTRHETHSDNSHTFYCHVTIVDPNDLDHPITFEGSGMTKKEAEKSAAQLAYDHLNDGQNLPLSDPSKNSNSQTPPYVPPQAYNRIYFLDIENMPQCLDYQYPSDALVLGFIGRYSHHYKNHLNRVQSICQANVIDSANRDAADIFLSFTVGAFAHQQIQTQKPQSVEFVIVSSDHFSEPLQKCLHTFDLPHRGITSLNELSKELPK